MQAAPLYGSVVSMNGRRPVATRVAGKGRARGGEGRRREKGPAPRQSLFFFFVGWFPIQTRLAGFCRTFQRKRTRCRVSWFGGGTAFPLSPERAVAASHARVPLARNPRSEVIGFFSEFEFVWRMNVVSLERGGGDQTQHHGGSRKESYSTASRALLRPRSHIALTDP